MCKVLETLEGICLELLFTLVGPVHAHPACTSPNTCPFFCKRVAGKDFSEDGYLIIKR